MKTVEACEIQHDIEMFPDGNDTEVGERRIFHNIVYLLLQTLFVLF